jgi:peptide/nickel transport system substrate-binding protein
MTDKITNWTSADDAMVENAIRRGASRRELLKMLLAGGAAVAAGSLVLGRATNAVAATPVSGGTFKAAGWSSSTADTLDPAKASLSTDYVRCCSLYNRLTFLDKDGVTQMELAESFDSKDAKTWTVKLRKGVTFHDGKPLTPQDVIFSIMRHKNPATGSKAKVLADPIEEVTASGPNEVTIRLATANADLPVVLGTYHFHIVKDGTTDFNAGIGTGPYKVKEFKPGVRSIAVRNPNYWKPGRPYVDEIEYVGIGDETARINALLAGELDLIGSVNPRSIDRILATGKHAIFETKAGTYTDLVVRLDNAPGNNPDFVLALKYLFNREQMVKSIMIGRGVVANDQPIDPTNRFYFKGLKQRTYDPEKAKFHFQKSGIGGTTVPVVVSPAATSSVEMGLVLQYAAKQIGMNLDVRRMPADGYWSQHWMKHPVGFGAINPRPSADVLLTSFFKSDAPWNESAWKNEKFDQLLVAARGEPDTAKRAQMYADMQVMIHESSGIGIPFFMSNIDGHNKRLKGLTPVPLGGMMGYTFAEHVWLGTDA